MNMKCTGAEAFQIYIYIPTGGYLMIYFWVVFSARKPGHVFAPTARRKPVRGNAPGIAPQYHLPP